MPSTVTRKELEARIRQLSREVAELRALEGSLRSSERRLTEIIDFLPDATFAIDRQGRVIAWNRAMEALSGVPAGRMLGKGDYEYALPFYGVRRPIMIDLALRWDPEVAKGYAYIRREGEILVSENRNPTYRSEPALLWNSSRPLYNAAGEVAGAIQVTRDITHRMRIEEELKASEERYRLLFENSHDGIFVVQGGTLRFPNPRTLEVLGYTAEELARLPFTAIIHPEDREMVAQRYRQRLAGDPEVPATYPIRVVTKGGEERQVQVTSVRVVWEGEPATVHFVRDITRQTQAEQQLRQAQRMQSIGTLAGGIAHDFNNLLTGILGHASLVRLETDPDHPHHERLRSIEELAQSGARLTGQLLGFARGGKYAVVPTDLNHLVARHAAMFGRTRKEISVRTRLQEGLWPVEVDQGQVEQALMNLSVNAWQAMAEGGRLDLQTANTLLEPEATDPFGLPPGRYVRLSVSDTGIGMDAPTRQRIFDPFFTTRERERGTGLGLATVYGIVKNHGGLITVYSELGEGATFNVYLPASTKAPDAAGEHLETLKKGTETVLLVDDEAMIREVGRALLEKLGYRVRLAAGGREALEIYRREGPGIGLVILDIIMPQMGGGETFAALKALDPGVRVLLSSGYSIDGKAGELLQSGCRGFIQKPFDLLTLSLRLREILDRQG